MTDFQARAASRRVRCEMIASRLRGMGYAVDWKRVNRAYKWFVRWDDGRLALGYLVKMTGIQQARRQKDWAHDQ